MDPPRCGALSDPGLWIRMRLIGPMGLMFEIPLSHRSHQSDWFAW
jgi:hypothetical protein